MERPSTGKEIPGAHRKKSFKGCARNKEDLESNEPLSPFPKKQQRCPCIKQSLTQN